MPGMRFAGTRNTLRWSLDASDELGLTPCFTVPAADPIAAPAATTAAPPPGTKVPEAASPFRAPPAPAAPFLVPSLPPLPLPTTGGRGLSSVAPPRIGAPRVTGVVAVVVDPDDWLAAGTRLRGEEVVHFNSMTSFRAVGGRLGLVFVFFFLFFYWVCTTINKLFLALFTTHLRLTSTHTHSAHSLPKLLSLCWAVLKSISIAEPEPECHQLLQSSDALIC